MGNIPVRLVSVFLLTALLAACGAAIDAPYASDEVVSAKTYREPGPSTLTLITMVSNRSGSGAHSALVINGTRRVMFDPAGSFEHETVPERNDVLYGISPAVLQGYKSAHARSTFHVVSQTIEVTAEQAAMAMRLAETSGPVSPAFCSQATSTLLSQIPGFSKIKATFFPVRLQSQFGALPGVTTEKYFEDDEGGIVEGVQNVQL